MASKWGERNQDYVGPELEDCNKCWHTILNELVSDAKLEIWLQPMLEPSHRAMLVVVSPGVGPAVGQVRQIVWATKELQAGFQAITYRQLYDLLIVAYRRMEGHLSGQNPLPLP